MQIKYIDIIKLREKDNTISIRNFKIEYSMQPNEVLLLKHLDKEDKSNLLESFQDIRSI